MVLFNLLLGAPKARCQITYPRPTARKQQSWDSNPVWPPLQLIFLFRSNLPVFSDALRAFQITIRSSIFDQLERQQILYQSKNSDRITKSSDLGSLLCYWGIQLNQLKSSVLSPSLFSLSSGQVYLGNRLKVITMVLCFSFACSYLYCSHVIITYLLPMQC